MDLDESDMPQAMIDFPQAMRYFDESTTRSGCCLDYWGKIWFQIRLQTLNDVQYHVSFGIQIEIRQEKLALNDLEAC